MERESTEQKPSLIERIKKCCRKCRQNEVKTVSILVAVILGLMFLFTIVYIIRVRPTVDRRLDRKIRNTNEYLRSVDFDVRQMNQSVDPCKDFYEIACGFFLNGSVPQDISSMSNFVLESRTELEYLYLPIMLYEACTNGDTLRELGTQPLNKTFEAFGDWPMVKGETWDNAGTWDLQNAMLKAFEMGFLFKSLFEMKIVHYNRGNSIIMLAMPSNLHIASNMTVSLEIMRILAAKFGAEHTRVIQESNQVKEFILKMNDLVSRLFKDSDSKETTEKYLTLKKMQELCPYFRWLEYVNRILSHTIQKSIIKGKLVVSNKKFFSGLDELLHETPKRTLANFFMWHLYAAISNFLSEEYKKIFIHSNDKQSQSEACASFSKQMEIMKGEDFRLSSVHKK